MKTLLEQIQNHPGYDGFGSALEDLNIINAICLILPSETKLIRLIKGNAYTEEGREQNPSENHFEVNKDIDDYDMGFEIELPDTEHNFYQKTQNQITLARRIRNLDRCFGRYIEEDTDGDHISLTIQVNYTGEKGFIISFFEDASTY
jgi:hypothetical protein